MLLSAEQAKTDTKKSCIACAHFGSSQIKPTRNEKLCSLIFFSLFKNVTENVCFRQLFTSRRYGIEKKCITPKINQNYSG